MLNFKFGRLLKGDSEPGFVYNNTVADEAEWPALMSMVKSIGTHWQLSIKNYMREDLVIVNSLRTAPVRIPSIYSYDRYPVQDTTNFVIIELRSRENVRDKDGSGKFKSSRKIEIRCPGHYLQNNSLFVEELGWYFTVESRVQATRECLGQDARFPESREVDVPKPFVQENPVSTFADYAPLVRQCIERTDRIHVRVGVRVDVDPIRVPEEVKSLRIAVYDQYFSPYKSNRMIYDPSFEPDEFAIENFSFEPSEPLYGKFSLLKDQPGRSFFVKTEERTCLKGKLVDLAVFADEQALSDYLFAHQSEELYDTLTQRLVDRNGNHALLKQIRGLEEILVTRDSTEQELRQQLKYSRDQVNEYKDMAKRHEETIKRIKTHHEEQFSYDAVMTSLTNERDQIRLDYQKLVQEKEELIRKAEQAKSAHNATRWKSVSEILKSGWGIILTCITIGTALYKGWNKLNSNPV